MEASDLRKIKIAFDAATLSKHTKYRLGASLFRGSRLISTGINQIKTHTKSPHSYRMIHAEIDALLRVDREAIEGSTLYVVRILKNLNFAASKPCDCCWEMACQLGVRRVIYFEKSGFVSEIMQ